MLIGALSGTNKLVLALVAGAFILFALASAFLLPRYRPNFPGQGRGLRFFVVLSLAFFVAMMAAVLVFGKEAEEGLAEAGAEAAETSEGGETGSTVETSAGTAVREIEVSLLDFKVRLPEGTTLSQGKYDFVAENDGQVPHNLVINGPEVDDAGTPVFAPGESMELNATLAGGTYEFYCSVPGHREAGMTIDVEVAQ